MHFRAIGELSGCIDCGVSEGCGNEAGDFFSTVIGETMGASGIEGCDIGRFHNNYAPPGGGLLCFV